MLHLEQWKGHVDQNSVEVVIPGFLNVDLQKLELWSWHDNIFTWDMQTHSLRTCSLAPGAWNIS